MSGFGAAARVYIKTERRPPPIATPHPSNPTTTIINHLRRVLGHPLLLLRPLPCVRQRHRPPFHARPKVDQAVATTASPTIRGGDEQHVLEF